MHLSQITCLFFFVMNLNIQSEYITKNISLLFPFTKLQLSFYGAGIQYLNLKEINLLLNHNFLL
jgi:hypothetical protein